jgi:hypothetical protein
MNSTRLCTEQKESIGIPLDNIQNKTGKWIPLDYVQYKRKVHKWIPLGYIQYKRKVNEFY